MKKALIVGGIGTNVYWSNGGIKDESILRFIFMFLLFCLPHKKVTKKVTTANTMLCNTRISIFIRQEAWCTHPWTATYRCLFAKKIDRELRYYVLDRPWQNLALCVGCPRIVRNSGCTAFVSGGQCEKDRQDFLFVEGFFFLFGRCQKENK